MNRTRTAAALLTTLTAAVAAAAVTAVTGPGAAAVTGEAAPGAAASATRLTSSATCPAGWGSVPEETGTVGTATGALTGLRTGRHPCFDRLVLDGASWAQVRYTGQVVEDGSGRPVPLRGGARLEILTSRADDVRSGRPTYTPAARGEAAPVAGFRTVRQVAFAGSFEGRTTIGLGVRARLPFRVLVLDAGTSHPRVVVDVAHTW